MLIRVERRKQSLTAQCLALQGSVAQYESGTRYAVPIVLHLEKLDALQHTHWAPSMGETELSKALHHGLYGALC